VQPVARHVAQSTPGLGVGVGGVGVGVGGGGAAGGMRCPRCGSRHISLRAPVTLTIRR
jgi:hypothetical protein